ncbi:RNA polymerase-associated protein RTF1 homolog [Symsagittifera roscoffensis]|uniref:RNA polymerase-associated protein RTF1 homolog n=1 Tax=Symsagittifera roscoffensis TaxID=84072 RepID=UPI00307C6976
MGKRNKSRVIVDSDDSEGEEEVGSPEQVKRPKVVTEQEEGEVEEESSSGEEVEEESEAEEEEEEEEDDDDEGSNGDDEMEANEDGMYPDGLDANLMGDEEDQAKLKAMSEKEREQELFNRLENRENLKTRLKIERQLKKDKKKKGKKEKWNTKAASTVADDSPPGSPGVDLEDEEQTPRPQRKVETNEKSMKMNAIQRLKDERERKKQNAEAQRQQREQKSIEAQRKREEAQERDSDGKPTKLRPSDIYSSDDDDDDDEDDKSEIKFRPRKRSSSSSSSGSSLGNGSGDSSSDSDSDGKGSDNEDTRTQSKPIETKDDLVRIRLSRHKLARWCHAPFFEEAVKGAFVRVNLGQGPQGLPVYRIAEIVSVVETGKVYQTEGTTTNKGLKLKYCKAERMYRLEFISNQPISDTEFTKWYSDMQANNQPLPQIDDVLKKQRQLLSYANHSYTEQDVDAIVQEKSRFRNNPRNYAMKKTGLMKDKLEAEVEGDIERLSKVQNDLNELEERAEMLDKQRTKNISAVTYINNRNKMHNLKQAEIAMQNEFREMRSKAEDPFTRRKSRPTLVTKAREGVIDQNLLLQLREKSMQHLKTSAKPTDPSEENQSNGASNSKNPSDKNNENNNDSNSASSMDVTDGDGNQSLRKREDLFSVHNFDINIDVFSSNAPSAKGNYSKAVKQDWPLGMDGAAPAIVPRRSLNLEQYKREKGLI